MARKNTDKGGLPRALLRGAVRRAGAIRALVRDRRLPLVSRVLFGLAFVYLICPIDLIPDFIPVVGHADDVVIVGGLVLAAWFFIPRRLRGEVWGALTGRERAASG